MLRGGTVSLYTHSEEAAGGSDLVAATELLPGDRVDLSVGSQAGAAPAKGFVHYDLMPEPSPPTAPPVMQMVAFGEAGDIRILRFGDAGYSFSPGLWARVSRHSAVATWAVSIFSLLGLMALYQGCTTLGEGRLADRSRNLGALWRSLRGA